MKTIIVIPARNEEKTIGKVVNDCCKYTEWVYVFDDGSTDFTKIEAVKNHARVYSNPINLGKGSTVKFALHYLMILNIIGENDIVITVDADGQCDLTRIPDFVEKIREGYDLVVGKRKMVGYPPYKKFGNWFLNLWSSVLSGLKIRDSESGYKAFTKRFAEAVIKYSSSRKYGIEMEMNIICGQAPNPHGEKGFRINYITVESDYAGEKGTKFKDGIINALTGFICWGKIKLTP